MFKSLFGKRKNSDIPQSFGYKNAWFAFKMNDFSQVVDAFFLKEVEDSTWESGISEAYEQSGKVFITPPLNDWTLVVGCSAFPSDDVNNDLQSKLEQLSSRFGEVQIFFTHRILEMHGWAKAVNGHLVRGYAYIGESDQTLWDNGNLTQEEQELGFSTSGAFFPNEDDVMRLADKWSVNPSLIEQQYTMPSLGHLGRIGI